MLILFSISIFSNLILMFLADTIIQKVLSSLSLIILLVVVCKEVKKNSN